MSWDPAGVVPRLRVWIWVTLAMATCLTQCGPFLDSLRPDVGEGNDFFQEWSSARNFLEGRPIYEETGVSVERYLGYRLPPNHQLTIRYNAHPPASVLLGLPFARLRYRDATLAWNLVSLLALGFSLFLALKVLDVKTTASAVFPLVTLVLLCDPLREHLRQGQLGCVLLVLLTGAWALGRSGRLGLAGVLVGLATAIKLFPGFLLVYFGLTRQWRTAAAGLLTFAVVTQGTLGLFGAAAYRDYIAEVIPSVGQFESNWLNSSIFGLTAKLFSPRVDATSPGGTPRATAPAADGRVTVVDHVPIFSTRALYESHRLGRWLGWMLVFVLVAALGRSVRALKERAIWDSGFSLALTVMLLVSPITWPHYFVLLLVPWILVWHTLEARQLIRAGFLTLTAVLWAHPFSLYALGIPRAAEHGETVWGTATPIHVVTVLSLQTYALLGLACLLHRLLTRTQCGSRVVAEPLEQERSSGS